MKRIVSLFIIAIGSAHTFLGMQQAITKNDGIQYNVTATQALITAVLENNVPKAQEALAQRADPNAVIIQDVREKCKDDAWEDAWQNVNLPVDYSGPLLHYAILNKYFELVRVLIHTPGISLEETIGTYTDEISVGGGVIGFDHNCMDNYTPLGLALDGLYNQYPIVLERIMVYHNEEENIRYKLLGEALEEEWAQQVCEFNEMVKIVLEAGANPNDGGSGCPSPLYRAGYANNAEAFKLLLEHDADYHDITKKLPIVTPSIAKVIEAFCDELRARRTATEQVLHAESGLPKSVIELIGRYVIVHDNEKLQEEREHKRQEDDALAQSELALLESKK